MSTLQPASLRASRCAVGCVLPATWKRAHQTWLLTGPVCVCMRVKALHASWEGEAGTCHAMAQQTGVGVAEGLDSEGGRGSQQNSAGARNKAAMEGRSGRRCWAGSCWQQQRGRSTSRCKKQAREVWSGSAHQAGEGSRGRTARLPSLAGTGASLYRCVVGGALLPAALPEAARPGYASSREEARAVWRRGPGYPSSRKMRTMSVRMRKPMMASWPLVPAFFST